MVGYVVYGSIAGSFRRSTLNNNANLTKAIKWTDNLATIMTMVILSFIVVAYVLLVIRVLEYSGLLLLEFGVRSSSVHVKLFEVIGFVNIAYNILIISALVYSTSYLYQCFFDSEMMFFTLAIVMLIALLLFGGTVNNFFGIYMDKEDGLEDTYVKVYTQKPTWLYVASQMFPFYAPTQMLKLQGDPIRRVIDSGILDGSSVDSIEGIHASVLWDWKEWNNGGWMYNLLWLVPYAHIFAWWFLGKGIKILRLDTPQR